METLSLDYLIKDSPTAVVMLDVNMCFISNSKLWLTLLKISSKNILGKSFYDILPETPTYIITLHQECLAGKTNISTDQKFIDADGKITWLRWKINSWKDREEKVAGLIIVTEDISLQKREEELLLKAERVARIGGWEVDLLNNKVYWTQITKEIHEQNDDYEPNLEEGINYYKKGEHRERITQLVTDAMTLGKPWDEELIIVTAKNNEIWVRAKGDVEIFNGKCIRIYGTFQEIDQKKKAELKYKETAERLKIATRGSKIGIWDFDVLNKRLVWDDNMYSLYGIQKETFDGNYKNWQFGVHPEDKERCEHEIGMAITGEKEFDTEFRVIWPNGEIRHIKAAAVTQRTEHGKALKMIGTNWDITELKNTKLQLLKTEESLQGSFENSSIGMALVGLDGKWTKINRSLSNSLGFKEEELLHLTFKDITHPDDRDKDIKPLIKLKTGQVNSIQLEKRYLHKNGHNVYALLTVTAVKNIKGQVSHFIAQIVDLNEQKEAENKLTKLLQVSQEQNNSLMNFAHIVSHNLRSHSTNMGMLAGFLAVENEETERASLIKMLKEASSSLEETVMHLNDVVNVKASADENMLDVNLADTIQEVQKNISVLLKEKEATCIVQVPKQQKVKAIPAYINSILLNMFTNSLKYNDPKRAPIIEITSQETNTKVQVTFKDNGLGIDLKRHAKKIFGMYKTFHDHKDAKGIGLFITKNQIEAMNGQIEVESTVGVGTTFKLYFEKP